MGFASSAPNLVSGDTNGYVDVFLHDRQTGTTSRVSVSSSGDQGSGDSWSKPSLSADGRFVAFHSLASNLVSGDTNGLEDVFVHDRQTGQTTRISVSSSGGQGNNNSSGSSISADGRFVAFHSFASNLVLGDSNGLGDVFVHDRQAGQTARVSISSSGGQGNNHSFDPSVSADGRLVSFGSSASNLVSGDSNGRSDVFVHDRQTGQTTRASVSSSGGQGNGASVTPSIRADGRLVAFQSGASNLVAGDTNGWYDVFTHDRQTGQTTRVSVSSSGGQGNYDCNHPSISADGRFVAFDSAASNLVQGDTNGTWDVFVHDRGAIEDPPPPPALTPPTVAITGRPYIRSHNSRIVVTLTTRQTLPNSDGVLRVTLSDLRLGSYTFSQRVSRGTSDRTWDLDLAAGGVPRFSNPVNFTVRAQVQEGNQFSNIAVSLMPQIKLPVVVVRGIWISGDWEEALFVNAMVAYGYRRQPTDYPTFFYWRFDPTGGNAHYLVNSEVLRDNAAALKVMVDHVTRESDPITYARKVDIVAHSKGGLVSRQYLKDHDPLAGKVRRLIMACSPHAGAASSNILPNDPPFQELHPTHPWWRETPFNQFGEPYDNASLKALNQFLMPQTLDYYLLYGFGKATPANFTVDPPWYNTNDGDATLGLFGVLAWSAQGYEVVNENDFGGNSRRGSLIRAFDETQGAKRWTAALGYPYDHSGFLSEAAAAIYWALSR